MKKNILFYSLILGTVLVSSCGSTNAKSNHDKISASEDTEQAELSSDNSLSDSKEEAPAYSPTNVEEQLTLIAENASLWLGDCEGIYYQYAITDLDQNGRLEIITSSCEGTGHYSYNQIYEVNEALDSLILCEPDWEEGESQPDLAVSTVPVYYDFEHNVYLYVFDDMLKISATEYYENKQTLSLQNKQLVSCLLASRSTTYSEDSEEPVVTCTLEADAQCFQSVPENVSSFWNNLSDDTTSSEASDTETCSSELANEEYENIADTVLSAFEKKTASILWMEYETSETSNMDMEVLYHFLEQSYEGFLIQ
ncbi:MAG: hypothetical protein ACI4ES_16215 [Roseburia sp.]